MSSRRNPSTAAGHHPGEPYPPYRASSHPPQTSPIPTPPAWLVVYTYGMGWLPALVGGLALGLAGSTCCNQVRQWGGGNEDFRVVRWLVYGTFGCGVCVGCVGCVGCGGAIRELAGSLALISRHHSHLVVHTRFVLVR